jgi:Arc/MetJ family transcription regulator
VGLAEVAVVITQIEVDRDLLDEATAALGTRSATETIHWAMLRVVEPDRNRRWAGLAEVRRLATSGAFDFDLLETLDEIA